MRTHLFYTTVKWSLYLVLPVLLLASCRQDAKRKNGITKIELAYDGGSMPRKGIALSMDSSLTYQYYGDEGTRKKGFYRGKISQGFWDTVNMRLEQIRYQTLDTTEKPQIPDAPYFELIIYTRNDTKHLFRHWGAATSPVLDELKWLQNSYQLTELQPVNDSIHFETTLQIPPPLPPIPKDFIFKPPVLQKQQ